jgi:hypothetical protein
MGTSQSSKGPGSNVALVPPWADEIPVADGAETEDGPDGSSADEGESSAQRVEPLAMARRFGAARAALGSYARTGDTTRLRRGISHYIESGYSGSANMSHRMAATSSTARALGRVLDPAQPGSALDRRLLAGKSATEIMDAVVVAVRPHDGTLDGEASRAALGDALSELLRRFEDADLLNLDADQRAFAIESYVAGDVFRRFELDVGQLMQARCTDATTWLSRLREARNYIKEVVAEAFRSLRATGHNLDASSIQATVSRALGESFHVFAGYIR